MKKWLSICLVLLLTLCTAIIFVGCSQPPLNESQENSYCDPRGKGWYNTVNLPSLDYPFYEQYDGSYFIQIDNDGTTVLKTYDGEIIEGELTASKNEKKSRIDVSIQFENGTTATGYTYISDAGQRALVVQYKYNSYYFTDKIQQVSKGKFEEYRSQFIEFIIEVYETGIFPSMQEIKNNDLYKEFADYFQIDPCCGGPFTWKVAEKGTIENIESKNSYANITFTVDGISYDVSVNTFDCFALIKDGEIHKLSVNEITTGQCLIIRSVSVSSPSLTGIIYVEN